MDRREFLKKMGLGGAAVAGAVALGIPETTAEPEVPTLDGIAIGDRVQVFGFHGLPGLGISGFGGSAVVMTTAAPAIRRQINGAGTGTSFADGYLDRVGIVTAILAESSGKGYLMVEVDGRARKYYTHEVKKLDTL